jgi:phospholipid/cholesterol/gamma-HCH transport system substrate-binding protein/paraquat-inducible protein B
MSAPVNRWKLGLFVVLALAAVGWGITWIGMARLQRETHTAWAYFDEPLVGLEAGSAVKFRGQSIGTVVDIILAGDKKHLQVEAALYDDRLVALGLDPRQLEEGGRLPEDLRAQLVTSYLTQTSFVLVDFYPAEVGKERALPFEPHQPMIRTVRSTFRNVEEGLRDVLRELPEVVAATRHLLDQARSDLQAAKLPELSQRAERILGDVEQRVRGLDDVPVVKAATGAFRELEGLAAAWRDEHGPVHEALREVDALAKELRAAIAAAEVGATSSSLRAAGDGAAAASREEGVYRCAPPPASVSSAWVSSGWASAPASARTRRRRPCAGSMRAPSRCRRSNALARCSHRRR